MLFPGMGHAQRKCQRGSQISEDGRRSQRMRQVRNWSYSGGKIQPPNVLSLVSEVEHSRQCKVKFLLLTSKDDHYFGCPDTACATNDQGAAGCCDPASTDNCAVATKCYDSTNIDLCVGNCPADPMNRVWYVFPLRFRNCSI
jgi:hypothetical protein